MIQSMTGFGKVENHLPTKKITVEIRSLNSKNLDMSVKMPSHYREKELLFRNTIAKTLQRGKIDFSIYIETTGEEVLTKVNTPVVIKYIDQLKWIHDGDDTELLKIAARLPEAIKTERQEVQDEEVAVIQKSIQGALTKINTFRTQEGEVLATDFENRVQNISTLLKKVEKIDVERLAQIRERLEKAVSEIKENVDANRFEQELIFYLEKFDITEEKVRLANHLKYFLETLHTKESNGKKLGFISQEIGREINTMGAKSNHAHMQQIVVEMKDELEKIKEQLLNVL